MRKAFPKFIFILLAVLCSCKNHNPKPINFYNSNDSLLVLKNWHVVGPFLFTEQGNNLNIDNLNVFGYDENRISIEKFLNIDSKKVKSLKNLRSDFRSVTGANDKPVMAVNLVFGSKDVINANAYMGCIIRSDKEENLRLNFSSDNGAKVWLNNKLVLNYDKDVSVFAYEHYIPVTLKKGDNFLLVKVYNSSGDWLMYSRIEKESNYGFKRHQKIVALLNNRNFLKQSIIDSSGYLEANTSLPCNKYSFSITDRNKKKFSAIRSIYKRIGKKTFHFYRTDFTRPG